jgi:hypothetical protein
MSVEHETARKAIAAWVTPAETQPFVMANSSTHEDRSRPILGEAAAILGVLSAACYDAYAVSDKGNTSDLLAINPKVLAAALDGVGTLINFANFLLED